MSPKTGRKVSHQGPVTRARSKQIQKLNQKKVTRPRKTNDQRYIPDPVETIDTELASITLRNGKTLGSDANTQKRSPVTDKTVVPDHPLSSTTNMRIEARSSKSTRREAKPLQESIRPQSSGAIGSRKRRRGAEETMPERTSKRIKTGTFHPRSSYVVQPSSEDEGTSSQAADVWELTHSIYKHHMHKDRHSIYSPYRCDILNSFTDAQPRMTTVAGLSDALRSVRDTALCIAKNHFNYLSPGDHGEHNKEYTALELEYRYPDLYRMVVCILGEDENERVKYFTTPELRAYLVCAIVSQVICAGVFDDNSFGFDESDAEFLDEFDRINSNLPCTIQIKHKALLYSKRWNCCWECSEKAMTALEDASSELAECLMNNILTPLLPCYDDRMSVEDFANHPSFQNLLFDLRRFVLQCVAIRDSIVLMGDMGVKVVFNHGQDRGHEFDPREPMVIMGSQRVRHHHQTQLAQIRVVMSCWMSVQAAIIHGSREFAEAGDAVHELTSRQMEQALGLRGDNRNRRLEPIEGAHPIVWKQLCEGYVCCEEIPRLTSSSQVHYKQTSAEARRRLVFSSPLRQLNDILPLFQDVFSIEDMQRWLGVLLFSIGGITCVSTFVRRGAFSKFAEKLFGQQSTISEEVNSNINLFTKIVQWTKEQKEMIDNRGRFTTMP